MCPSWGLLLRRKPSATQDLILVHDPESPSPAKARMAESGLMSYVGHSDNRESQVAHS